MKKNILLETNVSHVFGGLYQYSTLLINLLANENSINLTVKTNSEDIKKFCLKHKKVKLKYKSEKFLFLISFFFKNKLLKVFLYNMIIYINNFVFFNFLKKFILNIIFKKPSYENYDVGIYPSQNIIKKIENIKKTVSCIHDLMHIYEGFYAEYSKAEKKMRNILFKNICNNSDIIIADSNIGKKQINDQFKFPKKKIRILNYIPHFNKIKKIKYKKKGNFFLYPAQFWEHKNHLRLLDAIYIAKQNNKIKFKVIFTGSEKNNLARIKNKIQILQLEDTIIIKNYVTERQLCKLYQSAKALIYVSLIGPTNIPPLEAMYFGCPVICSDIYAAREQLNNAAYFVNPYNALDIAKSIIFFLDNTNLKKQKNLFKGDLILLKLKI